MTVGVDHSSESLAASRWAAREAVRRGYPLRLVHALSEDKAGKSQRDSARELLADAEGKLRRQYPELSITTEVLTERAEDALVKAAGESRALVIGSHGVDRLHSFFLGDTGLHIVARAQRPVILLRAVPEETEAEEGATGGGGIAVAVNLQGSYHGLLDFAFRSAQVSGHQLYVVHARKLMAQAYAPTGSVVPHIAQEIAEEEKQKLADVLKSWSQEYPDVHVTGRVRLESPARAIVRQAVGSNLLIVGRRRRDRPSLGPRIGPVAQAAVHHAACPVAVVPHD
ncbi:hypothetical protein AN216_23445 [Streptomyces oceani]|uniref:UspA domain-containing protein n=1 Tax=Streptomyces oceani TaxID=1075402 RepID=A0A1E7JWA7_9ACTN|nr:hypothetical protein AN216_23445 [Streptomyces oceani]